VMVLFVRHGLVTFENDAQNDVRSAARAVWGALFTITSFLTTTGFESADWTATRNWSGLGTPGLMLVGLSLIGGGVATTAGGIKLLRVYALWKHGQREIERLVHPSLSAVPVRKPAKFDAKVHRSHGSFSCCSPFPLLR
jgi:trk system potassium uptake protein TrkH